MIHAEDNMPAAREFAEKVWFKNPKVNGLKIKSVLVTYQREGDNHEKNVHAFDSADLAQREHDRWVERLSELRITFDEALASGWKVYVERGKTGIEFPEPF